MGRQLEGSSSGDASKRAYAFYNYHSMPIPSSGIEKLIRCIGSQLSISLIQLFFCCDVRAAPSEVVDFVEKIPNCEIVHLGFSTNDLFERDISSRILRLVAGCQEPSHICLVSEHGSYTSILDNISSDWELSFFHPPSDYVPEAFVPFAIELPLSVEEDSSSAPDKGNASLDTVHGLNKNLGDVLTKLTGFRTEMSSCHVNGKDWLQTKALKVEELMKGDDEQKSEVEEDEAEEELEDETEDTSPVVYSGNGWDSFPEPDLEEAAKMNGWDEVDKEMETEKATYGRPGAGCNPFTQEKRNPFGGNPFDAAPVQAALPYNKDLYEERSPFPPTDNNFNRVKACSGFKPKGKPVGYQPERQRPNNQQGDLGQDRNPFERSPFNFGNGSGGHQQQPPSPQTAWSKEFPPTTRGGRNPFNASGPGNGGGSFYQRGGGPGAAGGPQSSPDSANFKKPAPQCPMWEDRSHRVTGNCPLWHPHKLCMFFPKCRVAAADCGYSHPFCTEGECQCDGEAKDPQLNHFFAHE